MKEPRVVVYASGGKEGGGSGFEELVKAMFDCMLHADIVGVVSNHEYGGVHEKAVKYKIPFIHFPKPWDADGYQQITNDLLADYSALSGWLKHVKGLDLRTKFSPRTVINIHPGDTEMFGGEGFHGKHVHRAVLRAYLAGEITHTYVTMHFVTEKYDEGPVILRFPVAIKSTDTVDTLAARVLEVEHTYQWYVTNLVVNGHISWDGKDPASLRFPKAYMLPR